jgi:type II secretory pathway pseudopilin PulG
MKNTFKKMAGVTLLEVMLVLAIAAMIIVMSVRYYQSATSNQQANTVLGQVQSIVAAADQMAQSTGAYTTANNGGAMTTASIQTLLPAAGLMTPWGQAITIGNVTSSAYTITLPTTPATVCALVRSKVIANNHFTGTAPTACDPAVPTDLVLTYTSNI